MTPLAIGLGLAGLAWGVVADRISSRWPEHLGDDEDDGPAIAAGVAEGRAPESDPSLENGAQEGSAPEGSAPEGSAPEGPGAALAGPLPIRGVDWRTGVVAVVGAAALYLVGERFSGIQVLLFGAWAAVLVLMLATDLDQRLLPDVLTLPLIPISVLVALTGLNPFLVNGNPLLPLVAAVLFPVLFFVLSIPFGAGAIGIGDLKLLVSVGLTLGLARTFTAVVLGTLLSGVVVLVLLATRRIGRRSYIPYGPFLIIGTLWAALVSV